MPPSVGTGVKAHIRVAARSAAETIDAHAADVNADLIVMGRSTRFMHLARPPSASSATPTARF